MLYCRRTVCSAAMFGFPGMAQMQPMMFDPNAQQQMMQQGGQGGRNFPGNGGNNGGGRQNGQNNTGVCDYFARTGNCRFGASCKFQHVAGGGGGGGGAPRTTGTKLTAQPTNDDTLPSDLVLDYDNIEHSGRAARAVLWGEKPLLQCLAETKENANGKKILVNKAIAAAGPAASKLQQIALHAHTMAKNDMKSELGVTGADELLDELLVICKKRAPYPYRMSEHSVETQAVKDEITELKDVMLGLAKNAQEQQEKMHKFERQQHEAVFYPQRRESEVGSAFSSSRAGSAAGSFGSGSRASYTRMGMFSPGGVATPMGRRPRKMRLARRSTAAEPVIPRAARWEASFADGGDVMSSSGDEATPPRSGGGGGPMGGPEMPQMPVMETVSVGELCNDPIRCMQNIPDETLGWKFADQLTGRASELLTNFKKVQKKDEDPILDANPIGDKYGDLLPKAPVGDGGITRSIQLQDLGRLATLFVPRDFSLANDIFINAVLHKVRISQAPLTRIAHILRKYGVEMAGLPSFKLGVMMLALCIAKDRREDNLRNPSTAVGGGPQVGAGAH